MENNDDHIIDELIMRFLDNELSDTELAKFKLRRTEDKAFDKEVNEYENVVKAVAFNEREKISKQISLAADHNAKNQVTNDKIPTKTITMNQNNTKRRSIFPMIAAAVVAILVAGYFWTNTSSLDPEAIFNDNYSQQMASVKEDLKGLASQNAVSRSGTPEDTMTVVWNGERILKFEFEKLEKARRDQLISGLNKFDKSDWGAAVAELFAYTEKYPAPIEDQTTALFYLAKSRLNEGMYGKAADTYNKFLSLKIDNKELNQQAEWDRAMSYIKLDQSKVRGYLDLISKDNGHKFQDDAKGLIDYFE